MNVVQSLVRIELSEGWPIWSFSKKAHGEWVEQELESGLVTRDDRWSESIAVGSFGFVETVKNDLGIKATHRDVIEADGSYALRETMEVYGVKFAAENEALRHQNTFLWDETVDEART